jgi:hypothetical protein
MLKKMMLIGALSTLFVGCASVPTSTGNEASQQLKQFNAPASGQAGLYLYRNNSVVGAALKKDIWVDGNCIGETARGIFFYEEVAGGQEHEIATESEFSPNILKLNTESGKNYFIQQYIKPGVIVGGANLRVVDEATGKTEVQKLQLAEKGKCSKAFKKS